MVLDQRGPILGGGVEGVEKGFLDSDKPDKLALWKIRHVGELQWRSRLGIRQRSKRRWRTHFEMCPSRNKTVFICERRSGSWVAVVYVETALGSLTGVVGSDAIVLAFV